MPPTLNTLPVTRQPKKTNYTDDKSQVEYEDDDDIDEEEEEDDDDDIITKCDDFDRYAQNENDGNGKSVSYKNTTVDKTGSVRLLGSTVRCKSANATTRSQHPPIVGPSSQPQFDSLVNWSSKTSTSRPLAHRLSLKKRPTYVKCANETVDPLPDYHKDSMSLIPPSQCHGPPPPSPSPFTPKWPGYGQRSLDRIPARVIEVFEAKPLDQRRWPSSEAQRFPKSQQSTLDKKIPPPVIRTVEMKPEILDHGNLFKIITVQPRTDRHDYRLRPMATGSSSTFDSSTRKPFFRQSNQTKDQINYSNDDYLDATGWMSKMPVFAKCPPAKSKSKYLRTTGI